MDVIRHRVRARGAALGAALDGRSGLGFKAYRDPGRGHAGFDGQRVRTVLFVDISGVRRAVPDGRRGLPRHRVRFRASDGPHVLAPGFGCRLLTGCACQLSTVMDPCVATRHESRCSGGATRRPCPNPRGRGRHPPGSGGIDPRTWQPVLYATFDGSTALQSVPGDLLGYQVLHVSDG